MPLYPYQKRVRDLLLSGRSVILRAPTGAGKTRAALAPFLDAFYLNEPAAFPRQALYAVPLNVLATQFEREIRRRAEDFDRRRRPDRRLEVRIQTGERPEDPEFLGDLIFTNVDQLLSSALGVPYSLPSGRANLNVGAVFASYLVFDEFHLFPLQARQTLLQLLRLYGTLAPFLIMTATLSETMAAKMAALLGAELVQPSPEEIHAIETRGGERPPKRRRFRLASEPLGPAALLDRHGGRSLVVCNTVDRAQRLFQELLDAGVRPVPVDDGALTPIYELLRRSRDPDEQERLLRQGVEILTSRMKAEGEGAPWALLLHSRFERVHRRLKERFLQEVWGPSERQGGILSGFAPSLLVVATQVVEVGVDVSAQVLHTELAPAASLLQRAGRCARYPGEEGEVIVYPLETTDEGKVRYGPYRAQAALVEATWTHLQAHDGQVVDAAAEQALVDEVHGEEDRRMFAELEATQGLIQDQIEQALFYHDPSLRPALIRDTLGSRSLIVYAPPEDGWDRAPYRFEAFSFWIGSLLGEMRSLKPLAESLPEEGRWVFQAPQVVGEEEAFGDEEDREREVAWRWVEVEDEEGLRNAFLVAVNPRLASYDPIRGLRLEPSDGAYRSPELPRRPRPAYGSYRLESYVEHTTRMVRIYERRFRDRLAWVARRLPELATFRGLSPELLERAVRLVLVLHDLGKLDRRWQDWAARYQEAIGEGRPPFLVAHTHYEKGHPDHERARRQVKGKPRTHAGEGAYAALRLLGEALEVQRSQEAKIALWKAAVTAIARHHSPYLTDAEPYVLDPRAQETVATALEGAGLEGRWATRLIDRPPNNAPNLERRLLSPDDPSLVWLLYFLLVRVLRLTDGLSQEVDR